MAIVCGTDFSVPAEQAIRVAARLAAARGETLQLLHVIDELGAEYTVGSELDALYDPARRRLRGSATAARALGAKVEAECVAGSATRVLAAASVHATLVVVASLGARSSARWPLGSVAERLARTSHAPVLVVRDASAFEAWLTGARPLRVVLGIDRTETSRGTSRWLRTLSAAGAIHVVAAHLASPEAQDMETLQQSLAHDLREDLAASGAAHLTFMVRRLPSGQTATDHELVSVADDLQADLLVVGTHQRTMLDRVWHGSVSRGALQLARMSVVLVPSVAALEEARPAPIIREVLVATDFSELGNRAIEHAASLLPEGGTLHLVHVLAAGMGKTPVTSLVPMHAPSRDEHAFAEVRARLERLVPRELALRGIHVEVHALEGDVADQMCSAAERLAVDVVCMASRAHSQAAAAVLGSSTQEVLARIHRPVLVVRTPDV